MAPTVHFSKSFIDISGLLCLLYPLGKQKTAKPQHFVFTCPLSSAQKSNSTAFWGLRQSKFFDFLKIFLSPFLGRSVKGQDITETIV
jgi:hypothetical protein